MKLSIIIVNYNVRHFLRQCLISVFDAIQNIEAEVFVVDNNSQDGSVEMVKEQFPNVKLIVNQENTGFSKANNLAIRESKGEYVLLLNPDTLVQKDTFEKSIGFMDGKPEAGSLGVKMINGKGVFLPESKRSLPVPAVAFYKIFGLSKIFPNSKRFGSYHLSYLDNDQIHEVEVLSGAYMFIRKKVLDEIGYLDEDFFMYGEDVDLSYRIIKAGFKNYYYPETRIIHYKGESTKKGSINYVLVFYSAMQIFVKKHFTGAHIKWFSFIINFAIWLRATLSIMKRIGMHLIMPIIDFGVIYTGMLILAKYWEQSVLIAPYPDVYRYLFIPLYILVWIVSISINKGYRIPFSLQKTNRGILLGTIIILLIYSLLPETSRYSRAIIIFGAMWTTIAMNSIRYILHKLKIKQFYVGDESYRSILIFASKEEAERVSQLVQLNKRRPEKIGYYDLSEGIELQKIDELIKKEKINEITFCTKSIAISKIIDIIYKYQHLNIEFKIAPPGEQVLIGSQDIQTPLTLKSLHIHEL